MKRSTLFRLAWLALPAVLLAGCPGGAGGVAGPGVYQLQMVNGSKLPIGDGQHLFVNGVLDLGPDGTWCIEWEWRGSLYSRVSADRGTFSQAGGSVSFSSPAGENAAFQGAVDDAGAVSVDYVFGGVSDTFTFSQPADSLTPHCDR